MLLVEGCAQSALALMERRLRPNERQGIVKRGYSFVNLGATDLLQEAHSTAFVA